MLEHSYPYWVFVKEDAIRACVFDIETSSLEAVGAGFILCAVIVPVGKRPKAFRYDEYHCSPGFEGRMLKAILGELESYDMVIGHNIDKFDIPYLRTRAMVLGIPCNLHPISYDTLKAYRRLGYLSRPNGFGKPSAGLGVVGDILGVTTKENNKTVIGRSREQWKAIWENPSNRQERTDALDEIVSHCIRDVGLNEAVFNLLWKADANMVLRRIK